MLYQVGDVVDALRSLAVDTHLAKLDRFGINGSRALGVPVPSIRKLAGLIGKDHVLALQLWDSGIHEARILASFIEVPALVDSSQMDRWVGDFDSWDVCDQCCNMLVHTSFVNEKICLYMASELEFVRRAAFVLICEKAIHVSDVDPDEFDDYLSYIEEYAYDNRNFVKKAVSWALRQIGKRSYVLHQKALDRALKIRLQDSKAARWIASDVLRDLNSEPALRMLVRREQKKGR